MIGTLLLVSWVMPAERALGSQDPPKSQEEIDAKQAARAEREARRRAKQRAAKGLPPLEEQPGAKGQPQLKDQPGSGGQVSGAKQKRDKPRRVRPGDAIDGGAAAGSGAEGRGLAASPASRESLQDLSPTQAAQELERVLCYIVESQHADGSWGVPVPDDIVDTSFPFASYYAWNQASHALGLMALMEAPEQPARDAALEAGIDWLCRSRMAHRAANWDVDSTWAALYGFVCLVRAAQDPRFGGLSSQLQIQRQGEVFYQDLLRRQTPDGGWAYYDDRPYTSRPKWATSFCTALVLPALLDAIELGWAVDKRVAERAKYLVQRCALPNGAYGYSFEVIPRDHGGVSINQVPGSLGRIQVCNWALARAGDERVSLGVIRKGLAAFFDQHVFLDMARTRPVPHESWFANAGYFYFFGHYYAAQAISLLPEGERELWHRRMRHHITKTLTDEGSCTDFQASSYLVHASTSYAALVLAAGLPESTDGKVAVGFDAPQDSGQEEAADDR